MICPQCRYFNTTSAKMCPRCGYILNPEENSGYYTPPHQAPIVPPANSAPFGNKDTLPKKPIVTKVRQFDSQFRKFTVNAPDQSVNMESATIPVDQRKIQELLDESPAAPMYPPLKEEKPAPNLKKDTFDVTIDPALIRRYQQEPEIPQAHVPDTVPFQTIRNIDSIQIEPPVYPAIPAQSAQTGWRAPSVQPISQGLFQPNFSVIPAAAMNPAESVLSDEPLQVRVVGFWRRFVAATIDIGAIFFLIFILIQLNIFNWETLPQSKRFGVDYLIFILINYFPMMLPAGFTFFFLLTAYLFVLHALFAQTLGKFLLGIMVVTTRGNRIGPILSLLRIPCYFISALLLFSGFLWCGFDKNKRGLHDILTGTYVVKKRQLLLSGDHRKTTAASKNT